MINESHTLTPRTAELFELLRHRAAMPWEIEQEVSKMERELATKDATIAELQEWKDSAMTVLAEWHKVGDYAATPSDIGKSFPDLVLSALKGRDTTIEKLRAALAFYGGKLRDDNNGYEFEGESQRGNRARQALTDSKL